MLHKVFFSSIIIYLWQPFQLPHNNFEESWVKSLAWYWTLQLTTGSYVSMHSSRYEACEKFGEHKRCVGVARGVAESNSSFLSALQTSQVLHILMNAQLTYEPIVL